MDKELKELLENLKGEILESIESKLDEKLDEKLKSFESNLDERLDEKLDEKLKGFESNLDERLDEKLKGFESKSDEKLDEKLKGIKEDIQIINYKLDISNKKIDDLDLRVRISESNIRKDIKKLSDENDTVIEILKQHNLLPR